MHRLRAIAAGACALLVSVLLFAFMHERGVAAQPNACGMTTFSSSGVVYRVLFAKNGAVQQYLLAQSSGNTERDHDALKAAEAQYGPEAADAPPLQIVSFKPGAGGMMVPDKAVDSCGRVTHFH
jgi:membrane protease YdiL (CAAX protease family)